jgi:hypothetical protein
MRVTICRRGLFLGLAFLAGVNGARAQGPGDPDFGDSRWMHQQLETWAQVYRTRVAEWREKENEHKYKTRPAIWLYYGPDDKRRLQSEGRQLAKERQKLAGQIAALKQALARTAKPASSSKPRPSGGTIVNKPSTPRAGSPNKPGKAARPHITIKPATPGSAASRQPRSSPVSPRTSKPSGSSTKRPNSPRPTQGGRSTPVSTAVSRSPTGKLVPGGTPGSKPLRPGSNGSLLSK